jgi:superfamily II DNA or RNA helicase
LDNELKFIVRGWVSSDIFKKLLSFSDYLGREKGFTVFKISKDKVLGRGFSIDHILETLEEAGAEYPEELVEQLEQIKGKQSGNAVISFDGQKIYVRFSRYLGSLYDELRDSLFYDRKGKIFYTYPMYYNNLVNKLKMLGFSVDDLTGFRLGETFKERVEFRGELRDYQKEAVDSWIRNNFRGIIALPTGSGKTVIGVAALAKASVKTLIILYTKEQLMQWRRALLRFTSVDESYIGLYYSKEKRIAPITLATYQTAYRSMGKLAPYFTLLIIDEVHHLPAEKFKYIATMSPAPYRLGLSATPYREDGGHVQLFPLMGGVIYFKSPAELAEKGYLAKYKVVTIKVQLSPEERKEYNELRELYRRYAGSESFENIVKAAKKGNLRAIHALRAHSRMLQIFQKSNAKINKVKEIVNKELHQGKKIIVFAHYVDLAKKIADEVNGCLLTGSTNDEERKSILERFRNEDKGVLVVTTVGDEGLDIPDASVGILVAGTGSRRQFIQRLGRLLRPGPGKEAILYEIVAKGTVEEGQSRKRKRMKLDELTGVKDSPEK